MDGGFAMISGEPGLGKSKILHLMAQQLAKLQDVVVERPQSTVNDFYREMSALFGDDRLPERFRTAQLAALGTRLRLRLPLEPLHKDHILEYMRHALEEAGGKHLMTESLMETLAEHCCGNLRMLNQMAADLLAAAAEKQLPRIDEGLYLEMFSRQPHTRKQIKRG
jgi:hypothetical protein